MATREEILEKARAAKAKYAAEAKKLANEVRTSTADAITPPLTGDNLFGLDPSMLDKARSGVAGAIRPEGGMISPEDVDAMMQGIGDTGRSMGQGLSDLGNAGSEQIEGMLQGIGSEPSMMQRGMQALPEGTAGALYKMRGLPDQIPNMDQIKAAGAGAGIGIRDFLNRTGDSVGKAASNLMDALPQGMQDPNSMMNQQRQRMMEMEQQRLRQEEEWKAKMQKAYMLQQQSGGRTGA